MQDAFHVQQPPVGLNGDGVKVGVDRPPGEESKSFGDPSGVFKTEDDNCTCCYAGYLFPMTLRLLSFCATRTRLKARWSKLASVACIESTRDMGGKISTEQRYVISSLPADSCRILHAVRAHWGIENGLRW